MSAQDQINAIAESVDHDTREFEHPRDGEPAHEPSIDGPDEPEPAHNQGRITVYAA